MTGELFINGTDAYTYGVSMGKNFIGAIKAPLSFKEDVENNSTLQHGKRVVLSESFFEARDLSLSFVVTGDTREQFSQNEKTFFSILYGRKLTIKIKGDDSYYRLLYKGTSATYGYSPSGTVCTITAKFTEINPDDRAELKKDDLFII